jgi:hypothetical protein
MIAPRSVPAIASICSGVASPRYTTRPLITPPAIDGVQASAYPVRGMYRGAVISTEIFSSDHPLPNSNGSSLGLVSPHSAKRSRAHAVD